MVMTRMRTKMKTDNIGTEINKPADQLYPPSWNSFFVPV